VQEAEDKGKAARKLSAEISKAARIDFFRKKSS
jgi:RNA processing factor Prp31